ncbi:MAG: peptidase M28 family protein, partial [Lysobacteraceae bacterium]
MKNLLLGCILILPLAAGGTLSASPLPQEAIATATQLRDQALAGSGAWEVVESLTTEVGPRLAGTPADARAVAWAVEKFRGMGFDRVYTEPVRFPVWRRGHERAEVVAPWPQPLYVTALGRSVGTGGRIEAEVVEFSTLQDL